MVTRCRHRDKSLLTNWVSEVQVYQQPVIVEEDPIPVPLPEVAVGTDDSGPYADDAAEEGGGGPATGTRTRARLKTRPDG